MWEVVKERLVARGHANAADEDWLPAVLVEPRHRACVVVLIVCLGDLRWYNLDVMFVSAAVAVFAAPVELLRASGQPLEHRQGCGQHSRRATTSDINTLN